MAAESSKGIKQFKVPHVYAIIYALMVIFAVLTWIVPSGSYQCQEVNGREVTVAGTYEQSEKTYIDEETGDEVDLRQGVFDVLQAPTRGIQEARPPVGHAHTSLSVQPALSCWSLHWAV